MQRRRVGASLTDCTASLTAGFACIKQTYITVLKTKESLDGHQLIQRSNLP